MANVNNIDLMINIRDLIKENVTGINIYCNKFPTIKKAKDFPNKFILIKSMNHYNTGNINTYGNVEVCAYTRNLSSDNNQPDLHELKKITDVIYPILTNCIKGNTAVRSIRDRIINHSDIGYHYVSMVCETISLN